MIHNNRPKLTIPMSPLDYIIEGISILMIIGIWVHLILVFGDLPDTIPTHFNATGKADGYGDKSFLFFIPILTTAMYIGLLVLAKYPHLHNYMVNITEENAPKQYRFAVTSLRIINMLVVLMFAYINYQILMGARTDETDLGMGFLITVISGSVLLPVVLIYYQNKLK